MSLLPPQMIGPNIVAIIPIIAFLNLVTSGKIRTQIMTTRNPHNKTIIKSLIFLFFSKFLLDQVNLMLIYSHLYIPKQGLVLLHLFHYKANNNQQYT